MTMAERIRSKIAAAFDVAQMDLVDESALHAGHAGAQPGGETHFRLRIVSADFEGLSRVRRHQQVYAALADELAERVHALALETRTPAEAGKG